MATTPHPAMKKSWSRGSDSTQFESPARFCSPLRWDAADSPEYRSPANSPGKMVDNSMAVITVDKPKQISHEKLPDQRKLPQENNLAVFNLPVREEPQRQATKVETSEKGSERRLRSAPVSCTAEEVTRKAGLGFRLCEMVVCLISFSVMAANKTQGWSGDSYDRYKEYRYCLSMNVIGFAYSGLQACDLAFQLVTGKHMISHHLRYHFQFFLDQVVAYLLISASSSAATRVDDWQSNWGKDEFTEMATVSVGMSFLAFVAFAMSSLISGYILCNGRNSV
ncbi:CASP-like protein 4A3 [Vicia villosa]|uniref:CASP-like protein 4A3 n=1 Tax=Vicia villosa TaxID=3911 RepID=UPI00273AE7F8|nr:CASP-like protein 4A3 [Vicia villosa]